ncbi:hypothetical protein GGR54DRAFT_329165 [Hypoxylon sp. NC1633]|nr:hypothetical protein GGR54DRAFT_329165 [Hypoxylon sp. NC1633]
MKTSAFFTAAVAAATTVAADPAVAEQPTKVARDLASVTSVVAQVSAAMSKLDTTVKAFDGSDISGVQADAQSLVTALTSGTSALASAGTSGQLSLVDAIGLQDIVAPLGPASQALLTDLADKKSAFEKAALCTVVGVAVKDAGSAAKALVDGVVGQVPQAAQAVASQVAGSIVDTFTTLAGQFAADKCKDKGSSASSSASSAVAESTGAALVTMTAGWGSGFQNSSSAVGTSVAETLLATTTTAEAAATGAMMMMTMTVTVTAPCVCSTTSEALLSSSSSSVVIIANPITTPLTTFTVGSNSTFIATGALTATSSPLIVTAGAVAHGVPSGPVGVLAALAAFLFI